MAMKRKSRQSGFSLLETLLAVSTLAIGMIFVGGTFLAGIYFATLSTERTIATVAADEAFAKIRLYGLDPNDPKLTTDGFVPYNEVVAIPDSEQWYPSIDANATREYSWTALCRRVGGQTRLVEVTVFIGRRIGTNARYWVRDAETDVLDLEQVELPRAVRINVVQAAGDEDDELTIEDAVASDETDEETFVNDGATIIDDETGQIYRVLERYVGDKSDQIKLDRDWAGGLLTAPEGGRIWVVPRPASGGRSPLVAVYQEVLRF